MKQILSLFLLIISVNILAQNDVLKIGGMPCNYPYYYEEDEGEAEGYIPSVTKAIMEDAGLSYSLSEKTNNFMYYYGDTSSIDSSLMKNDLYMTGVINFQKRDDIYYSIPYLSIQFHMLSNKGVSYRGLFDLTNKRIGVIKHHASESRMKINQENMGHKVAYNSLIVCDNLPDAMVMLSKGGLDFIIISEQCIITQQKLIQQLGLNISYSNFSPLYIAVASKNEALINKINTSISRLQKRDAFEVLFSKYVVPNRHIEREHIQEKALWVLVVIVLFLFVVIYICRRIIKHKVALMATINDNLYRALNIGNISIWEYNSVTQEIKIISKENENSLVNTTYDKDFESIHPMDREHFHRFIERRKETSNIKSTGGIEIRTLDKRNEYRWIYFTADVIKEKDGYKWIGVCQDIDNIIKKKAELEKNNEAFMYIANNAPFAIFIKNPKTQDVLYHNKACYDVLNINKSEKITSLYSYIDDDALDTIRARDEITKMRNGNYSYNDHLVFKSGKSKYFYVNKSEMNFKNKNCLLTVMFDYKELARLETTQKVLDLYIPLIKAYTWSYDSRSDMFFWGSGYDTKNHSISKYLSARERRAQLIHPDYRELFYTTIKDLLDGKRETAQIKFLSNVENEIDYEWWNGYAKAEKIKRDNKEFVILHGFNMNVDKQTCNEIALNKLIEELHKAKEKAEESERMKSHFLANISHEIRTPLNAIVGFSSILPEVNEEDRDNYIHLIQTNNELLLTIINDILDLSKINAGMEIHREMEDLSNYFNDIALSLKLRLKKPNVDYIIENPYDKFECFIDKHRIGQVVTNLVTNAIKCTEKGYIKVGYTCKDNLLEIYVEDTGIGIAKEKQHLLFKRFQKVDKFMQGTGLGLSIVAAIMDKFGGDYGFETEEGVGSRFWVRAKINMLDLDESKKENKSNEIVRKNSSSLKILIAEDIFNNYLLIKQMLSEYELIHVENGKEAVKAVEQGDYDLVLMDIAMPVMNGLEATEEIRKFNKEIPIIAITAKAFAFDKAKVLEAGCNDLITKPVLAQVLISAIQRVMA